MMALEWIDMVHGVLTNIGCLPELSTHVATRAMQWIGKIFWDSTILHT